MTGFQDRASLCCPGSSEGQGGLGWSLPGIAGEVKGRFSQGHQTAMREQVHAQQCPQVGQAPAETRTELQITQQHAHDALTLGLLRSGKSESGNRPLPYTSGGPNVISQECQQDLL